VKSSEQEETIKRINKIYNDLIFISINFDFTTMLKLRVHS
jgi:hypothetical protein